MLLLKVSASDLAIFSPPPFFLQTYRLSNTLITLADVESTVLMDSVLQKQYRGKLEHLEGDLHNPLPPLCRTKRLVVTSVLVVWLQEGSSAICGDHL